ncbi:RHS repeat-associated core domain-containing protein [Paenibacillus sp. KACC 21273]|uniref:RHS repeat domain-containing protein n=1 Tax=Paenibacillus sp. KACC 21273 TaxID=3025665 RepID=UPI002366806A|nr:RHS repeat-associated core domain-containing protein [Paenibacillus sp. KACC 21273]WDF51266.1 RHS repeat-associated core domain-containing protein [Paenibacillus sp. KACC 21273]
MNYRQLNRKLTLWILSFILIITVVYSPSYAHAETTPSSSTAIAPPSVIAPPVDVDLKEWNASIKNTSDSVVQNTYDDEDQELAAIGAKINQNSTSSVNTSKVRLRSASINSLSTENTSTTSAYIAPLTQQQVEDMVVDGAELIDIYWVTYLYQQSGIDPIKLWKENQSGSSWESMEKKYVATPMFTGTSVTNDVYTVNPTTGETSLTQSQPKLNASSQVSIASTSSSSDDLDEKYNSVMNDLIAKQSINQTNKLQFAEYDKNNETIDPASGSLSWKENEMSFPGRDGLDLNLGIMYNSNESSPYERNSNKKGRGYVIKKNHPLERYDLGLGWSFQFPSVQIANNYMYYYDGQGASYQIDLYNTWSEPTKTTHLVDYQGKDLLFMSDAGSFNNGQDASAYYLEHADKKREYFAKDGRLVGIVDRYGNTITFRYTDRQVYNDKVAKVFSTITDSLGRTIEFKYDSNLRNSDFQGENLVAIARDANNQEIKRVTFAKSRINLQYNGANDGYAPVLYGIIDPSKDEEYLDYDVKVGLFTFRSGHYPLDTAGAQEPFALLKQVKYPRLVTNYTYESTIHDIGKKGAVKDYRIISRADQVYKQINGDVQASGDYSHVDYSYAGSYSNRNYEIADKDYRYSSTSKIKSNTESNGLTQTTTFSGEKKLISVDTVSANNEHKTTTNLSFDPVFKFKPTKTQTTTQDADGTTTRYSETIYTDWGDIQSQTDNLLDSEFNNATTKSQHTTSYTYDNTYKQLASKSWYQDANKSLSEKYAYTSDGRLQTSTNALGETKVYSYDASPANPHQIAQVTVSEEVGYGLTSKIATRYGAETQYAYPTEQTTIITNTAKDGSKNTQTIRVQTKYDMSTGLPVQQIDSNGKATTTTYDILGRPIKVVSPSITNLDGTVYGVEDQYTYTNRVSSAGADNENANILTLRVDTARQYTNTTSGAVTTLGRESLYYDGFGFPRVDETWNESNGWTRAQYHSNDQGNAIYGIDNMGNTQTVTYDAWGQSKEATDAYGNLYVTANHLTQQKVNHFAIAAADVGAYRANSDNRNIRLNTVEQSYDAYGHLLRNVTFKDGAASHNQPIQESYTYDLEGNILSYTDPNGNTNSNGVTNTYSYDALNRLTTVQDALNQKSRYNYDVNGQLTRITAVDPSGKEETLYAKSYNEIGAITSKTDLSGQTTNISYNARGLVAQESDRNGTTTNYQYDERGERTVATLTGKAGNTLQTKMIFGSDGNLLTDRHELYMDGVKTATQTSTIDKQDRVTSLVSTGANAYSSRLDVAYDTLDRVTNQKNSLAGSSYFTNYCYDKLRLSQIQTNGAQTRNTANVVNVNYAYTALGKVQSITFPTLADGSTLKESFTYDPLNRLIQMSNTKGSSNLSSYNYAYDNNGNILTIGETLNDGATKTSTYSYDKLNRLIAVKRSDGSTASYTYDLRGNRKTLSDTQELTATKSSNYSYDLDNKLISATIDGTKTTIDYLPDGLRSQKTTGETTTQYGYNGSGQVVSEKVSNGNTSSYIRGDRVLVKKDQTASKDYYYLFNGHGDVVQMVDTSGNIVNSYGYDEWGNIAKQQETVSNSFKYAGEAYDNETGLYYLKARYYDPSQGRFLNEDSYEGQITNPLSLNGYTYVHNNPLIYVDPTGHLIKESYNDGALRNLLKDARSQVSSKSDKLYSKYKDKITEIYGKFVDDNKYDYLFDLTTGTSTYGNSAGKSDWAIEQLVSGYQSYELSEYIATMAMGGVGGVGPGGQGRSRWWHPGYVDNLSTTKLLLGVQQSSKGMSTLGSTTRANAWEAGKAWVGSNANELIENGTVIGYSSADKMRAFRIQYKPKDEMWRANYQQNTNKIGSSVKKAEVFNVHVDILD